MSQEIDKSKYINLGGLESFWNAAKTYVEGKMPKISKGESTEEYVSLGVNSNNDSISLTLNDQALQDELTAIKGKVLQLATDATGIWPLLVGTNNPSKSVLSETWMIGSKDDEFLACKYYIKLDEAEAGLYADHIIGSSINWNVGSANNLSVESLSTNNLIVDSITAHLISSGYGIIHIDSVALSSYGSITCIERNRCNIVMGEYKPGSGIVTIGRSESLNNIYNLTGFMNHTGNINCISIGTGISIDTKNSFGAPSLYENVMGLNIMIGSMFSDLGCVSTGAIFLGAKLSIDSVSDPLTYFKTGPGVFIGSTGVVIGTNMVGTCDNQTSMRIAHGAVIEIKDDSLYFCDGQCAITKNGIFIGTAENASLFNGFPVSYFAKASDLSSLTDSVNSIKTGYVKSFGGEKGEITLDNATTDVGAVKFLMDSNTLKGSVNLPTDWIKDINVVSSLNDYLTISENEENGISTITLGGSLKDVLDSIPDIYAKKTEIPSTLPNPQSLSIKWKNKSNVEQTITYNGGESGNMDLTEGIYYAETASTAESSNIANTSKNSEKLGNQLPEYYATKSSVSKLNDDVSGISNDINTIKNDYIKSASGENGITVTEDNQSITISGSEILNKINSLTGKNVKLGETLDSITSDKTIYDALSNLLTRITALNTAVKFGGVFTEEEFENGITGELGEIIVVGSKEYICIEVGDNENYKWELIGFTDGIADKLDSLDNLFKNHKHTVTTNGSVNSTFTGEESETVETTLTTSCKNGVLTIKTNHKHIYTPKGTITSTFVGKEVITNTYS